MDLPPPLPVLGHHTNIGLGRVVACRYLHGGCRHSAEQSFRLNVLDDARIAIRFPVDTNYGGQVGGQDQN